MTHEASVERGIVVGRRPFLKTVGIGLAGTAALTGSAAAATGGSGELARELEAVRAATQKYRDVAAARADGYVVVSPYTPNMGFHFVNPALVAPDEEAEVDTTKPPILVYFTTGAYAPGPGGIHESARDGELRLGAVEFAHVGDDGAPGTPANYFSDESASRSLAVSEEDGWHWTPGPDITALHVWVHRGNPAGVFHPTNPTID